MTTKPRQATYKASESQEQCCVVDWWRIACKGYSLPEFALYAVPNGANKSINQAMKFKREGLRKGIPDLCLDVPCGGYHGLRIEMKVKPNKPSPEQREVMVYLAKADYRVCLCYSAQEAITEIKVYLHD